MTGRQPDRKDNYVIPPGKCELAADLLRRAAHVAAIEFYVSASSDSNRQPELCCRIWGMPRATKQDLEILAVSLNAGIDDPKRSEIEKLQREAKQLLNGD